MNNELIRPVRKIKDFHPSIYGNKPAMNGYELPDAVSVNVKDLFPNMPDAIYQTAGDDLSKVAESTRKALKKVDMSMIKPGDTVNIMSCEHGFLLFGGKPYIEMIKTLKHVVEERTGAYDIRTKIVMYRTPREGTEVIDFFRLEEEIGNVEGVTSYEKGVPIETRIGTVYGLDKVFNADHIIFAYYDDPREVYCSHYYRKAFKAFTMDLMRLETRSLYHMNFGSCEGRCNAGVIVPTSVYDSDFVQSKWTFSCMMATSPNGLCGIDADNSLYDLDERRCAQVLKFYPYMTDLLRCGEPQFMLLDGERWPYYTHCGGIINGAVGHAGDVYDFTEWSWTDEEYLNPNHKFKPESVVGIVINHAWYGCTYWATASGNDTVLVGDELVYNFKHDSQNMPMINDGFVKKVDTLPDAIKYMKEKHNTDRYLIFDGSFGYINCSRSKAEDLFKWAPIVKKNIDEVKYPLYMKQRNLPIPDYMK